ncbi:MAG: fibrobacter succinogenes major paralogous domain-containing protein [Chitinophagales bacterium]|nr:fibrobacter succinogenes major paralogous domain-containing protein [Chitinophagales bacterium]
MKIKKNLKLTIEVVIITMSFTSCIKDNTIQLPSFKDFYCNKDIDATVVIDIDGNPYSTVIIKNKEYMLSHLKTNRYNDGTPIVNIEDDTAWANTREGAWSYHLNQADTYPNGFASVPKLYNWYVVETGKLCPEGWRVLTDADKTEYLILMQADMKKYLSCGVSLSSEITGWRSKDGQFKPDSDSSTFVESEWTSTELIDSTAWSRRSFYGSGVNQRESEHKNAGLTCSCVRDL